MSSFEHMAEKLGVECPCGFTMSTPHGMDDAVAVVQLHLSRVHPDMDRSRDSAMKNIKKM
jgi:hypothetical protein